MERKLKGNIFKIERRLSHALNLRNKILRGMIVTGR